MVLGLRAKVLLTALLTAVLALAGMVGVRMTVTQAEGRNFWVMHTLEVIGASESVARYALQAQSSLRGYLLLREPALLGDLAASADRFERARGELERLVEDRPPQRVRAQQIGRAFQDWRTLVAPLAELATLDDVGRRELAKAGAQLAQVRALVDEMVSVEQSLLTERRGASARAGYWLGIASDVGIGLAVAIAAAMALTLALRVARDTAALTATAAALADGDLSRRATAHRRDELGMLGAAFNAMAERLERRQRDEESMGRMRDMLHASQTSAEAHRILSRLAPQCLEARAARLYVMTASRNLLAPAAGWGEPDAMPADRPFAPGDCWALRSGRPHSAFDPDRDVPCEHLGEGAAPSVCLPLAAQGDQVGVLCVMPVAPAMPPLAEPVAEVVGLTLANLRLREEMRNQAIRDPLTGLFNRRFFEETLARELLRAQRSRSPLSLIVLDIDHFKRFNDTHGHPGGDAMLKHVAATLVGGFRGGDVVCRLGGEEFVVIAPDCAPAAAQVRADAVRAIAHAGRVVIAGAPVPGPTLSGGVAGFPDHGDDAEVLFQTADRALYRAKHEGRDRVLIAPAS